MAIVVKEEKAAAYTVQAPASMTKDIELAVEEAKTALESAKAFPIRTASDFEAAMEERRTAKQLHAKYDNRRKEITGPLNAALKSTNDLFRPVLDLFEKTWTAIDDAAKPYLREVKAQQEREEQERQAELRRLAAREEKAEEKGQESKVALIQSQAAAVAAAPSSVASTKVAGSYSKPKWTYQITDESLIPESYWILDTDRIGREVRASGKQFNVPGIKAIEDISISSRK